MQQAFNDWAKYAGLKFRRAAPNKKADFKLEFASGDHKDGFPFDGKGPTLAHAFFPWYDENRGEIHFDADEEWTDK